MKYIKLKIPRHWGIFLFDFFSSMWYYTFENNNKKEFQMQNYKVYVQLREGYYKDVIIVADSSLSATYQARAQYGESNVIGMASPINESQSTYA